MLKIESYINGRAERSVKNGKGVSSEKSALKFKMLAVFIFVSIPLPMTGVWTGTAIAVFLGLKFKESILPIVAGNLIAGVIISLLAELFIVIWNISALDYVLWALFGLAIIILVITIVKIVRQKPTAENKGTSDKE